MSLTVNELLNRVSDFDDLTQKEQVRLIAFFHCIEHDKERFSQNDIKNEFEKQSLSQPSNLSREISKLSKTKPPILISNGKGIAFHRSSRKELENSFLGFKHKQDVSIILRELLEKIKGNEQKLFLEEAVGCFEMKSFRAAIILTWLLTMDTLFEFILKPQNLSRFNTAIQNHGKYRKITIVVKDDFNDIKESDFIELMRVAKLITNDRRKILDEKLGIRNSCAHPNSILVKDYKVISFVQDLVTNIIQKYQ